MKAALKKREVAPKDASPSLATSNLKSLELVGRGGMGEVYRARLTGPGGFAKTVAVKRIASALAADPQFRELFLSEGKLLSRISHPNIVQVFEVREEGEVLSMVMEWVDGITLKTLIERAMPHEPLAIAILDDILKALTALHEFRDPDTQEHFRVAHRDISPHNIMIDQHGIVKLIDFGVAKSLAPNQDATNTEFPKGKFPYLSPEMAKGEPTDERSDLFSLGVVAFELMTGQRLFKGRSDFETIEAVKTGPIPELSELRKDLTKEFGSFVDTLLQRDLSTRFSSARAALRTLRQIPVGRATEEEIRRLVNTREKKIIQNGTVSDKKQLAKIQQPFRSWVLLGKRSQRTVLLVMVLVSLFILFIRPLLRGTVGNRLIWEHEGKVIDLSDVQSTPVLSSEDLSTSACYHLCGHLGALTEFFLLPSIAKQNDAKTAMKPARTFLGETLSVLKTNEATLTEIWRQCDRIAYCQSAKSILGGFTEVTSKIDLGKIQTYSDLSTALTKSTSTSWEPWKVSSFLKMDPILGKRYLDYDEVLSKNGSLYRTKAYAGFDIVKFPRELFPLSSSDCRDLGDLLYAKEMGVTQLATKWKTDRMLVWVVPAGTSLQIESFDSRSLYVRMPDGYEDQIFKSGICHFVRNAFHGTATARHWYPNPKKVP